MHQQPPRDTELNCPYQGECGGCSLSDMPYPQQLAMKQAHVEALLQPFGSVEPIRGMDVPWHYRNKVHIVFAADRRGKLISGVYRQGTHRVVPVENCGIEDARASAVLGTVTRLAREFHYQPFDEDRHTGFLRHAMVRAGRHELMLILVTAMQAFPGKNAFLQKLRSAHPEITTVVQNLNPFHTNMVLGKRETTLYGQGFIEDTLCGLRFRISAQSFYQVNSSQTEVLYALAGEMAAPSARDILLDAYCGVGTIGLTLAGRCKQVVGVELNPQAVRDAIGNAKRNGIANATFLCGDAGQYMQECAQRQIHPDTVLMDPPRTGSDATFLQALIRLGPKRVVYVSCNPETLARDLRVLCAGGYRMQRAVPVDMFPLTEHVECVVLMSRVEKQR